MQFLLMINDRAVKHLCDDVSETLWMCSGCESENNVQSSRSTSGPKFIFPVTVWKINRFSRREGRGNSILRSRRPGRSRAGSRVSARLVAIITYWRGGAWEGFGGVVKYIYWPWPCYLGQIHPFDLGAQAKYAELHDRLLFEHQNV